MLSSLFDEYSLNARVRPALLALLPATLFAYLAFPQLYQLLAGAIGIFVVFGIVTALAHFSRSRGRAAESELYAVWGGKPTTALLRHSDVHLDPVTKRRYHDFLAKNIENWRIPTEEEELREPRKADQAYESAVRWLLEHTRDQKRYALLFKENISYGFRRNCYGIKWLAAMLAIAPLMAAAMDLVSPSVSFFRLGGLSILVSATLSAALLGWWLFVVREAWVKDAAIAYAIRLLAACEFDGRT